MAMLCKKEIQIKNQNTEKCLHQKAESYKAQLKLIYWHGKILRGIATTSTWLKIKNWQFVHYEFVKGRHNISGNVSLSFILNCSSSQNAGDKSLSWNKERQRLLAFNVRDREKGQRLLVNCFSLKSKSIKPPKVEPFVICLSTLSRMMDFTVEATKYYKEQRWMHV